MTINFKEIPDWWALCPNEKCPLASQCLRHQAYVNAPDQFTRYVCLLPTTWRGSECRYYQDMQPVTLARGFKLVFGAIKDRHLRSSARNTLLSYFGSNGTYYRYYNGERVLSPKQQQYIKDLLAGYNRSDVYTPDLSVVYGLKARAYLTMEDWANAEKYAKQAQTG